MSVDTINGSAYPRAVEHLLPEARQLADRLGEVPSRNRLMRELKIGAPKADALRAQLARIADEESDQVPAGSWNYSELVIPDPDAVPDVSEPAPTVAATPAVVAVQPAPQVTVDGYPGTPAKPAPGKRAAVWPVVLLAAPAFVAVWSGWVGLGKLTGFGMVDLLPGIVDPGSWATIDSAITLPIGVETYAAYALYVWLSGRVPDRVRRFARWSAIASLIVGALGQVAYHLLVAAGVTGAPWQITTAVACLPVAVLGMGAALAHLVREDVTR